VSRIEGDLPIPGDVEAVANGVGMTGEDFRYNCHGASIALVKSGQYPGARVARGAALGVLGQHSWVVIGDPYDKGAQIIDATLWSYDPKVQKVWTGTGRDGVHTPHGAGHLFQATPPSHHGGDTLHLTPTTPLSEKANDFLRMIGAPFDNRGWMEVAHLPVGGGWPAREIIEAMLDTPGLGVFVPIDIQGMLTDRNPGGLYLPGEERAA
jgi:hypothetical protein